MSKNCLLSYNKKTEMEFSVTKSDFSGICRTCLETEFLSPIFADSQFYIKYTTALFNATGIQVQLNDGLPQNLCAKCIDFLNQSIMFRKKSCDNQQHLKNIKLEQNLEIVTENCIKVEVEELNEEKFNTDNFDEEYSIERINTEKSPSLPDEETEDDQPLLEILKRKANDVKNKDYKRKRNSKFKTDEANMPFIPKYDEKERENRVICKICRKELSLRSIDMHMASKHPGADVRKLKCEFCDKYILKSKINRHMMLMHGTKDSTDLKCGYCRTSFKVKEELIEHAAKCDFKNKTRKISKSGRQLVECEVCHKVMQRASLKTHRAVKHAGLGPVCEHCGRKFGNKLRLTEHYRACHGYDKFKCSHCEFQCSAATAIRNHERRHLGERPYVCEQCGAEFHAAYLLTQHRHAHRTHRLIKCDLCPATFKVKNSLHMHKKTCHSTLSYKCELCDRTYSCRHYVVKHMRQFHEFKGKVGVLKVCEREKSDSKVDE